MVGAGPVAVGAGPVSGAMVGAGPVGGATVGAGPMAVGRACGWGQGRGCIRWGSCVGPRSLLWRTALSPCPADLMRTSVSLLIEDRLEFGTSNC